jgi:uncharacterized protein (TIGR00730 family)
MTQRTAKKRGKITPFYSSKAEIASLIRSKGAEPEVVRQLAFLDKDFLLSPELRGVRLLLEFLKCDLQLRKNNIDYIITFFGSARIPDPVTAKKHVADLKKQIKNSHDHKILRESLQQAKIKLKNSRFYSKARQFSSLLSNIKINGSNLAIVTGGGPGIMEAANRGAKESGQRSIGMSIALPLEQKNNSYIDANLSFFFHFFAIRKMHMVRHCRALIIFPGGFGTLDELFEVLTLISTKKMKPIPVILFGKKFWKNIINFKALYNEGMISKSDLALLKILDSAKEAITYINNFYKNEIKASTFK